MSDANTFAIRLVESVVPSEVEVAPAIVDAYIQGGKARNDLFKSSSNIPGAFSSAELIVITPYLLQAIASTGRLIASLLTSDVVGDSITAVKTALELISTGRTANEFFFAKKKDPATSQISVITHNMSAEVRGTGLSKAQCDDIALRTLKILLENSSEAGVLIKVLVENQKK